MIDNIYEEDFLATIFIL